MIILFLKNSNIMRYWRWVFYSIEVVSDVILGKHVDFCSVDGIRICVFITYGMVVSQWKRFYLFWGSFNAKCISSWTTQQFDNFLIREQFPDSWFIKNRLVVQEEIHCTFVAPGTPFMNFLCIGVKNTTLGPLGCTFYI